MVLRRGLASLSVMELHPSNEAIGTLQKFDT
jgi:hypothetical protein